MDDIDPTPTPSNFVKIGDSLLKFLNDNKAVDYLYKHQIDATLKVVSHFKNKKKSRIALAVLPTGTGKTAIAVLSAYALKAQRVLVITPSENISIQVAAAFVGYDKEKAFLYKRKIVDASKHPPASVLPTYHLIKDTKQSLTENHLIITNAHRIGGRSRIKIQDIPKNEFDLVIVDEAHHYPAETWQLLVNHFKGTNTLFLTATPKWKGDDILHNQSSYMCFNLSREEAIANKIIRPLKFELADSIEDDEDVSQDKQRNAAFRGIAKAIKDKLCQRNGASREVSETSHQAMVLMPTKEQAVIFRSIYNQNQNVESECCQVYVSGDQPSIVEKFKKCQFRTLVVVGRLLEGFDHNLVSVVAIARNVSSSVLFGQFVGRAVRKMNGDDNLDAILISHKMFDQLKNFNKLDELPNEEQEESEDEKELDNEDGHKNKHSIVAQETQRNDENISRKPPKQQVVNKKQLDDNDELTNKRDQVENQKSIEKKHSDQAKHKPITNPAEKEKLINEHIQANHKPITKPVEQEKLMNEHIQAKHKPITKPGKPVEQEKLIQGYIKANHKPIIKPGEPVDQEKLIQGYIKANHKPIDKSMKQEKQEKVHNQEQQNETHVENLFKKRKQAESEKLTQKDNLLKRPKQVEKDQQVVHKQKR